MPRKSRVDTPGALHHIIIRGIERKPIFKDKIDYGNFIDRFGYSGAEVAPQVTEQVEKTHLPEQLEMI